MWGVIWPRARNEATFIVRLGRLTNAVGIGIAAVVTGFTAISAVTWGAREDAYFVALGISASSLFIGRAARYLFAGE